MACPVVFADANVLYAAPVRDLLLELALAGAIRLHWSADVQREWVTALLRQRPELDPARLERTCALMDRALPHAIVTDYDQLVPKLTLPDPNDRHVLAAAIVAEASFLMTFNTSDFPAEPLVGHGVVAIHPDHLLTTLYAANPAPFHAALAAIGDRLANPPLSQDEHLAVLTNVGLVNLALAIAKVSEGQE